MMMDLKASVEAIKTLRALGAKIDLDDFGTGYSSLACLHQLPMDVWQQSTFYQPDISVVPTVPTLLTIPAVRTSYH